MSIYDASVKYREAGVPLVVLAGKGIRVGFVPRLGSERSEAAGRSRGDRRKL